MEAWRQFSKLEALETRLLLERCYSDSAVWEEPFLLFAQAEAEAGSVACEQLFVEYGI